MKPRLLSCLALGLLLASGCSIDLLTRDRLLTFELDGTKLKLSSNGVESTIELKPCLEAVSNYECSVLFTRRRAGFAYVLLSVSGSSRNDATGPCANGREENLVWLKLDPALQPQASQSVLVESCVKNIHRFEGDNHTESQLTMKYVMSSFDATGGRLQNRRVQFTLHYDNGHPEAEMRIESHEL